MMILLAAVVVGAQTENVPLNADKITTFHGCNYVGGSGNSPHLFDRSDVYQCDEGKIEIAGRETKTIEYGYVFTEEMGKPSETPHKATNSDYRDSKWCPKPGPQDADQKERCGDVPTTCWDGKPGTWDDNWKGYSCVTPDHKLEEETR
jgi:hypothetical protein